MSASAPNGRPASGKVVAIVGGGISGIAVSDLLRRRGIASELLESPTASEDGSVLQAGRAPALFRRQEHRALLPPVPRVHRRLRGQSLRVLRDQLFPGARRQDRHLRQLAPVVEPARACPPLLAARSLPVRPAVPRRPARRGERLSRVALLRRARRALGRSAGKELLRRRALPRPRPPDERAHERRRARRVLSRQSRDEPAHGARPLRPARPGHAASSSSSSGRPRSTWGNGSSRCSSGRRRRGAASHGAGGRDRGALL